MTLPTEPIVDDVFFHPTDKPETDDANVVADVFSVFSSETSCGFTPKRLIGIAIDGGDHSLRALNWAIENLFNKDSDLVHVLNCSSLINPDSELASSMSIDPKLHVDLNLINKKNNEIKNTQKVIIKAAMDKLKGHGFHSKGIALHGDPKMELCDKSKILHLSIMVIGTRNLNSFGRILLGSVSDYVLHHAPANCTVIIPGKSKIF